MDVLDWIYPYSKSFLEGGKKTELNKMIVDFYEAKMKRTLKPHATFWSVEGDSDYEVGDLQNHIEKSRLDIIEKSNDGDILEDKSKAGYRSDGRYMISKRPEFKIVDLNTDIDDYGSPACIFKGITEFPLDYWYDDKMVAGVEGDYLKSYWHSEDMDVCLPNDLGEKVKNIDTIIDDKDIIVSFNYNDINYRILVFPHPHENFRVDVKSLSGKQILNRLTSIEVTSSTTGNATLIKLNYFLYKNI